MTKRRKLKADIFSKKRMLAGKKGASLIEYGMVVGLVSVVAIGAVYGTGTNVRSIFETTTTELDVLSAKFSAQREGVQEASAPSVPAEPEVVPNSAPVFEAQSVSGPRAYNDPIRVALSATDVDGDTLTYSLSDTAPSWLSIDPATGEVSESGPRPHISQVSFEAIVSDEEGAQDTTTYTTSIARALSCDEIYTATSGEAVSGEYVLSPSDFQTRCLMVGSGAALEGGWTMVALQRDFSPISWEANRDWNGVGNSFALPETNIPNHTSTAFGRELVGGAMEILDAVDFRYTSRDIVRNSARDLPSLTQSGVSYAIHRETSGFYNYHNPDMGYNAAQGEWSNTLTFDVTRTVPSADQGDYTWAFSPNYSGVQGRGYGYGGSNLAGGVEGFGWAVYVR